jgi:SAM-dependent methyltransferase
MVSFDESYGEVTARYYDRAYAALRDDSDVNFYRALARAAAGPVLELGVGTGRVLLPIAADGIPCTGLDLSQPMLNALRRKPHPPTLRLVHGPMHAFDLAGERFALIYSAFRAFQHLVHVEDQLACLECVRRHLAPGGTFAFDVFFPDYARLAQRNPPPVEDARFLDGDDVIVRLTEVHPVIERQLLDVRMRYERWRGGQAFRSESVVFELRYFFRYELEHLLARAGFGSVAIYGDFARSPIGPASLHQVVVARVA